MASLGFTFDHTAVDQTDSFEPLPPGEYVVEVVDSEVRPTKAGDGAYISLQLRVVDGEYENRRIFTNINHRNPNPKAQAIGERQLAMLCTAVGLKHALEDVVDLHNVPVKAVILVEPAKDNYGPRNSVRAYKPVDGAAPAVVAAAQTQASSKPAAPWKR
jgi:hypothetical protein